MRVELVRIGNSRGIRIPKSLIEQYGLGNGIELRIENERLVMVPDHQPRQDWDEAFRRASASAKNEVLLGTLPPNEFDHNEWQW
jgi:antitoxin MazE